MDSYFNFKISDKGMLSRQCLDYNIYSYKEACSTIKKLRYGRNSNRSRFDLVLEEQKGTCSTKHAFLKQLAVENGLETISLCIGVYKMNALNTKGIGDVLKKYKLKHIPEAHTYLKYKDTIFDFTSMNATLLFYDSVLYEEIIEAKQVGDYKVNLHQQFLKSWIKDNDIPYTYEELWAIREACIVALSQ